MDETLIVAIVGAATGSISLGVQLATWLSSRTNLELQVNPGTGQVETGETDPYGGPVYGEGEIIFMQVTNRSPHAVKIINVGAVEARRFTRKKNRRGFVVLRPYPHKTLPIRIEPRDYVSLWMLRDQDVDWSRPYRFYVRTADNRTKRTRRLRVDRLPEWTMVG